MHPDLIAANARLHIAELATHAAEARAVRRPSARAWLGNVLVRVGHRLAEPDVRLPAPTVAVAR